MSAKFHIAAVCVSALALAACASVSAETTPPPPVVNVAMSHYDGTWLEIARRPMSLTNGCVAGYTTYSAGEKTGEVQVEDGCHDKTPDGKVKTIKARAELLDAGSANAKLRVHYPLFITWEYWVLYEAPDNSWFISADPKMKNLWIYARKVPTGDERAVMVDKAKSLGYDISQLEFPAF